MDGPGYPHMFQTVLCPLAPLPSFPRGTVACRGSFFLLELWLMGNVALHVVSAPFLQFYPPAPCWDLRPILSPIACDCNPMGSDPRLEGCDPVTGQCHCLPHVTGRACGQCQPGYYGLEPTVGCKRYVGHSTGLPGVIMAPCSQP